MFRDHLVPLKRAEEIAALANRVRELAWIVDDKSVDVVHLISRLCRTELPGKGVLKLKISEKRPKGKRAYVSFKPLALHVERRTWEIARWKRDPEASYILAHELGHILLHDHNAKPFHEGVAKHTMFGLEDFSAEWQADTFADHLLIPDHVLARIGSLDD